MFFFFFWSLCHICETKGGEHTSPHLLLLFFKYTFRMYIGFYSHLRWPVTAMLKNNEAKTREIYVMDWTESGSGNCNLFVVAYWHPEPVLSKTWQWDFGLRVYWYSPERVFFYTLWLHFSTAPLKWGRAIGILQVLTQGKQYYAFYVFISTITPLLYVCLSAQQKTDPRSVAYVLLWPVHDPPTHSAVSSCVCHSGNS